MRRAVCIHGHFYQPSRENPWTGEVEVQRSAAPDHDWNERVAAECYAPNTAARILDPEGLIEEALNTYSRISFTAAPTLLAWLARHRPAVYRAILDADQQSRERFSGHGSAIACCYNHIIMPLATREEKRVQVAWGVRDFRARFGREPEGMWLPETAVDLESLDIMAEAGLRFTVLAPHQAAGVRRIGEEAWTNVSGGRVDTTRPYLCRLPSGRSIAVFFYDGAISRDIAFGDLLVDGRRFAERLLSVFSPDRERPELVHIATDGETYGHHKKFGEMALAYCLRTIEARSDARLTVYGEHLAAHPPTHEAAVREGTSWSCLHGIERWRGECGCHSGAHPDWSQAWREPLREAVVMVRDTLAPLSAEALAVLVSDPAAAREDAVSLVLSRWSDEAVAAFVTRHARSGLSAEGQRRLLSLLETARQVMLMQTSCGWFFDDIAEPGSVQVMRHAGRAMDLARKTLGIDLEPAFVAILRRARPNDPEYPTGADAYEALVRPAAADLARIGAGAALYALVGVEPPAAASGMYAVQGNWPYRSDRRLLGTVRVRCRATGEEALFDAAATFAGMDRIAFCVREPRGEEALRAVWETMGGAGPAGAFARTCTASDLTDEERWTVAQKFAPAIRSAVCAAYNNAAALIRTLEDFRIPVPGAATLLKEHASGERLLAMLEDGCPDPQRFATLAEEMRAEGGRPDLPALGEAASSRIAFAAGTAAAQPDDPAPLEEIVRIAGCAKVFGLPLTLWESQNLCLGMRGRYAGMQERAGRGDRNAERWAEAFRGAAACLGVRVT
jgi:alpha-amylase/alpha-mannosidase (GH57 family)